MLPSFLTDYSRVQEADHESDSDEEDNEHGRNKAKHAGCFSQWRDDLFYKLTTTHQSGCWYFLKWLLPGLLFALGFFIQNVLLHLATHMYVQTMVSYDEIRRANLSDDSHHAVSDFYGSMAARGSLTDPIAWILGHHAVPTACLDAMSLVLIGVWFVIVIANLCLKLWARCCISGFMLSVTKGCFAITTVVPDASGWDECKERLGSVGVRWFMTHHVDTDSRGYMISFLNLLFLETFGVWDEKTKHMLHLRYCADMLYSGHTYFSCLFAMALYDVASSVLFERKRYSRNWSKCILGATLVGYVTFDMIIIIMDRFHYTLDCVLAIIVTYGIYTSIPVGRAAKYWSSELWINVPYHRKAALLESTGLSGDSLVPPCFLCPSWCNVIVGRYEIRKEEDWREEQMIMSYLRNEPREYVGIFRQAVDYHLQHTNVVFPKNMLQTQAQKAERFEHAIGSMEKKQQRIDWESLLENSGQAVDIDAPVLCCTCFSPNSDTEYQIEAGEDSRRLALAEPQGEL